MIFIPDRWRVKSASNYSKRKIMQQGDICYRDICSKVTSSEESPAALQHSILLHRQKNIVFNMNRIQNLAHVWNEYQVMLERVRCLDAYAADGSPMSNITIQETLLSHSHPEPSSTSDSICLPPRSYLSFLSSSQIYCI